MITGEEFLKLAEQWLADSGEALHRSAVSRAYYGAFHEASTFLAQRGFRVPRGDQAHAYLWRRLSNSGDQPLQEAGSDLNLLRSERNQADYRIERTITPNNAKYQVEAARRIVQTLAGLTEAGRLAAITQAIRDYERDILREETWQSPQGG